MPDAKSLRLEAISALEKSISDFFGSSVQLSEEEVPPHLRGSGFTQGWKIDIAAAERIFNLYLLIQESFPFSSPRLYLLDYASYLNKIPHIGSDGLLCLGNEDGNLLANTSIKRLFNSAYNLLTQSATGELEEDFRTEFLNYWKLGAKHESYALVKPPQAKFSKIFCCTYDKHDYFFSDESVGSKWMNNLFSYRPNQKFTFSPTICIALDKIWLPSEYPKSGADILKLLSESEIEILLSECFPRKEMTYLPILFHFSEKDFDTFAATRVCIPATKQLPRNRGNAKHLSLRKAYFSSAKLANMIVQRVDSDWLHFRIRANQANQYKKLKGKKVAIFGCGSIGGQLADNLCRTGIGQLTLFDPETLSWDNINRHFLGSAQVGCNKAEALKSVLIHKYPETDVEGIGERWESLYQSGSKCQLHDFDLVVSLIGSDETKSELFLSYCTHNDPTFPPVIFGWTEVWGAAGHALLIGVNPEDGCLACEDGDGNQLREIFSYDSDQRIYLPTCSANFAPYGFVEILPIVSMISDLVLEFLLGEDISQNHRIWVANIERSERIGGKLNPRVTELLGGSHGEQVVRTKWVAGSDCKVCHGSNS